MRRKRKQLLNSHKHRKKRIERQTDTQIDRQIDGRREEMRRRLKYCLGRRKRGIKQTGK